MFILFDFSIPKEYLNEIKRLGDHSIKGLLSDLIDYVIDSYAEDFEACRSSNISREFNDWINSLSKTQVIKLSHYVLFVLDYLIED